MFKSIRINIIYIIAVFYNINAFGQYSNEHQLNRAFRYSLLLKAYQKGGNEYEFGPNRIEHHRLYSAAVSIDFLPKISTSLYGVFGLQLGLEPAISYEAIRDPEQNHLGLSSYKNNIYGFYSITSRLGIGYLHQFTSTQFSINLELSLAPMFYPPGEVRSTRFLVDTNGTAIPKSDLEIFSETTNGLIYFQSQVAFGASASTSIGRFTAQLVWNNNFRNLMMGNYNYFNENDKVIAGGRHSLSGDYIGISIGYNPKLRDKDLKERDEEKTRKNTFGKTQLGFALNGRTYQAASTSSNGSEYWNQNPTFTGGCSIDLYFPIANKFAFRSGLGALAFPIVNFSTSLGPEHFNLQEQLAFPSLNSRDLTFEIPMQADYCLNLNDKRLMHFLTGISLSLLDNDASYLIRNGEFPPNRPENILLELSTKTNGKLHEQLILGTGISFIKANATWTFLVRYFHSFYPILEGSYSFQNLNGSESASGLYSISGNCLSISLIYFPVLEFKVRNKDH